MANGDSLSESHSMTQTPEEGSHSLTKAMSNRLRLTGILCVFATLIHIIVTILAFAMGYTKGKAANDYSVTVVVCAFGCLNTIVFALVTAYNAFAFSMRAELPTWEKLNSSFLDAVAQSFFLIFFLFPSLVVFIIHEQGDQIFDLLQLMRNEERSVYGVLVFHIVSYSFLIVVDVIQIGVTSGRLFVLQAPRREKEEEDNFGGTAVVPAATKGGNSPNSVQMTQLNNRGGNNEEKTLDEPENVLATDEEEIRIPMRQFDYVLFIVTFFVKFVFTIDLLIASIRTNNEGAITSFVCHLPFVFIWVYALYRFGWAERMREFREGWLVNYRLFMILHFAASICFFWVTFCIIILVEHYQVHFFEALDLMAGGRSALCYIMLLLFPSIVILYAGILFLWSKAMWGLDEIAMQRFQERTKHEKLRSPLSL